MIVGNIHAIDAHGLPKVISEVLRHPDLAFSALVERQEGKIQVSDKAWFCNVNYCQTQPDSERHTEWHEDYLDVQLILEGSETINYDTRLATLDNSRQTKADMFLLNEPRMPNRVVLNAGDFAVFFPHEPHQALCMVEQPSTVKKAVVKIPKWMLEDQIHHD